MSINQWSAFFSLYVHSYNQAIKYTPFGRQTLVLCTVYGRRQLPMKLKRVIYELYEIDLVSLHDQPEWHEIDREIFLEFDGGERSYFSWCNEPVQYSVGRQDHRFNMNEPDHVIDTSEWNMWLGLIGSEIDFIYRDESHQVLELREQNGSVYLSAQEQGSWQADVLHISNALPAPSS